jgi:hypothetical protein
VRFIRVMVLMLAFGSLATAGDTVSLHKKSESKALNAAMGATFTPVLAGALILYFGSDNSQADETAAAAIMTTGAVIGPGLGHLYAGNRGKFLTSTLIRTLCASAMLLGESQSDDPIRSQTSGTKNTSRDDSGSGYALFFFGAIGYGTITIYDFVTTGNSVDTYNERGLRGGVRIEPIMHVGSRFAGLRLSHNF